MSEVAEKRLRPSEYTEKRLITDILNGTYPPNSPLPPERELAQIIGVTRPTLREILHRLAGQGWIKIQHGKSTMVNDFWEQGGLAVLGILAGYAEFMPPDFITQLLDFRRVMIPACARLCAKNAPHVLDGHLSLARDLSEDPEEFAAYDWRLQELMAKNCGNRVYPLILNDFTPLFKALAVGYFSFESGRNASRRYYGQLTEAMAMAEEERAAAAHRAAFAAMDEALNIWLELQ